MVTKKTIKPEEVEIDDLDAYQQSRIKTEMWLSSRDPHTQTILSYEPTLAPKEMTWVPALFTAYREIIDNALDEMITHGHGDRLDITYNPKTMTFKISDNGRGIPITNHPKRNIPQATLALSKPFSGRNFNDETRGASRGTNGVGAAIVNFCSEWFKIDIVRDKKCFHQTFSEGKTELQIQEPLILPAPPRAATGTTITFKLSKKVFKDMTLPETFIRDRVYEVALCYPKLKVFYNGKQVKSRGVEKTLFAGQKPITFEINDEGFKSTFWLLPKFLDDAGEHSHGLVNAIPVFNGGSHIDTFKRLFYAGMIKALERTSKQKKLTPNRSDFADGMLIYNITEMNAPAFDSQSKTRLINENVSKIVQVAMDDPDFFKNVAKKNPEWIESVYERCEERTMKRDANDLAKINKASKKAKVESLIDAVGKDRSKCILYLTEGESAKGGLVNKRNPMQDAVLPLRGKIMNVRGESLKTVATNEALSKIMNSIGLIPGIKADRKKLRYGKVYFTCDADEDGHSIVSLLTNFAFCLWPELFNSNEEPFFYSFETPLVVAQKGKITKYWYADDYQNFEHEKYQGWIIRRCKGLAALTEDDWKKSLANPKLTPLFDDGELSEALSMLFDPKRADDRKGFMGI